MVTVVQFALRALASHIVQCYGPRSATVGPLDGRRGPYVAQLTTDHVCVLHVPVLVADGRPRAVVDHFHSPLIGGAAINKPNNVI